MADWLKQIKNNGIWNFLFGGFGSTVAVFFFGKRIFGNITVVQSIFIGIVFVGLIFSVLLLYYITKELIDWFHKRYIESVWGVAIVKLKDAYAEVHRLRKRQRIDAEEFVKVMIDLCDQLKEIFDKKTGANCSVSIKIPLQDVDDMYKIVVRNLCRDSFHPERDTKKYESAKHTVVDNTAYLEVVRKILNKNKTPFYINNNIKESRDYNNSSIGCYSQTGLPYQSELVYPIIPIYNDRDYKMCGFVCVDSDKPNSFDENLYDIPMMQGICDGIYDIFDKKLSSSSPLLRK